MTPYQMMEAIDAAENNVGELRTKYLDKSGWEHTSSTPGCYWMWTKEIDGKQYMLNSDGADRFQRELDYREMNKPHDPIWLEGACTVCGDTPDDIESRHGDRSSGDLHD